MAWITTVDAQTASDITVTDFDSASRFVAWAVTNGWCTRKMDDSELVVLYDNNGVRLTQKIDTTVYMFRALEHSFATRLARLMTTSTIKKWTYYAVDSDGDIHTVEVPEYNESKSATAWYYCEKQNANGSIIGWSSVSCKVPKLANDNNVETIPFEYIGRAERGNDADGWSVTLTYRKYAHIPYDQSASRDCGKWFIPAPPNEAKAGSVVHKTSFKQYVAWDNAPNNARPIYQNEETEVTEYSYLTESDADTIVAGNTSATSLLFAKEIVINWTYITGSGWTYVTNIVNSRGGGNDGFTAATDSKADKRFVGGGKGWCVTVTKSKYWASNS